MRQIEPSPTMSPEEFAKQLGDIGLLSSDEISLALDTLSSSSSSIVGGGDLAQHLVSAGKLTSFQAKAVLEQRLDELQIGNYEVLSLLGAGAMGTVYKARHIRMKRVVAIKVLARSVAKKSFIQRFQREVETLATLTHGNIVMAFDADEAEVGHFLVMEFVDGRDLASIVQQHGPLPLEDAIDAILQAAQGLEYAHAKNIIHRDIKPANIMRDISGVIKVADLGLARLTKGAQDSDDTASLTQAGGIVGTVDYMAPEQAEDSTTIDQRADIYSLGCTLHFVLVAQPPYTGNSITSIMLKHRDAPIPSLRAARPDAPLALDSLVTGMLAKSPADRIASMSEVIKTLQTVKAELERGAAANTTADEPISELTVILVEPSRTQAAIVRKYLQVLGIDNIHNAASGQQALELAKQHGGQAVVSSMHLGDMTGMQLATLLHADAANSAIGFVLTTSGSEAADLAALRTMPRTVLMPKPFDVKKLAEALARATGRSAQGSSDSSG